MFGELTRDEIDNLLREQVIGRIGCHADETTYVVPISYAYDGIYIYGHTEEGMKIDIMRKNDKICFQVDNMQSMADWQSVILHGRYEELTEGIERKKALEQLLSRNFPLVTSETVELSPEWPFPPDNLKEIKGIVYRIKIEKTSGRYERRSKEYNQV